MPYKDPEKKRENNRKWAKENREKQREAERKWRKANPEKVRSYKQRYNQRPEAKDNKRERNKRRIKRMGGCKKHRRQRLDLLQRDGHVCGICSRPFAMKINGIDWNEIHVDHIKPVAAGGTDDLANLQLAHAFCNMSKHDQWDGTEPGEPPLQLGLF